MFLGASHRQLILATSRSVWQLEGAARGGASSVVSSSGGQAASRYLPGVSADVPATAIGPGLRPRLSRLEEGLADRLAGVWPVVPGSSGRLRAMGDATPVTFRDRLNSPDGGCMESSTGCGYPCCPNGSQGAVSFRPGGDRPGRAGPCAAVSSRRVASFDEFALHRTILYPAKGRGHGLGAVTPSVAVYRDVAGPGRGTHGGAPLSHARGGEGIAHDRRRPCSGNGRPMDRSQETPYMSSMSLYATVAAHERSVWPD